MAIAFERSLRALRAERQGGALALIGLLVLLLGSWLLWLTLARVPLMLSTAKAQITTQQSVISLTAPIGGQVERSAIQLGQDVEKGRLLVQLDSAHLRLQIQGEAAQIKALSERQTLWERQIRQMSRGLRHLATVSRKAQKEALLRAKKSQIQAKEAAYRVRQLRSLSKRGYVARDQLTATQLEVSKLQIETLEMQAQIERLRWEYQAKADEQSARITQAKQEQKTVEGTIALHKIALAQLQLQLQQHRITAPTSGKISSILPIQPGEVIAKGRQLGTLLPPGALIVVADFSTNLGMGKIRRGQMARLRLDAFPWTQYGSLRARVERVARVAHEKTLRVELSLRNNHPRIPTQHGLTGVIEIEVEQISPWELLLRLVGKWVSASGSAP